MRFMFIMVLISSVAICYGHLERDVVEEQIKQLVAPNKYQRVFVCRVSNNAILGYAGGSFISYDCRKVNELMNVFNTKNLTLFGLPFRVSEANKHTLRGYADDFHDLTKGHHVYCKRDEDLITCGIFAFKRGNMTEAQTLKYENPLDNVEDFLNKFDKK